MLASVLVEAAKPAAGKISISLLAKPWFQVIALSDSQEVSYWESRWWGNIVIKDAQLTIVSRLGTPLSARGLYFRLVASCRCVVVPCPKNRCVAAVFVWLGIAYFRRTERTFADLI